MAKRRGKKNKKQRILLFGVAVVLFVALAIAIVVLGKKENTKTPSGFLVKYMDYISEQNYEKMYEMLDVNLSRTITKEEFIQRNKAIYEGIEISNIKIDIMSYDEESECVDYKMSFDTVAGPVSFPNKAFFTETEDGYQLIWDHSMIFPQLTSEDKVRVTTSMAKRGEIVDRNDIMLAGMGTAASVGIVPGKLGNDSMSREECIEAIALLLEIETDVIEKKLSASWVKDEHFVPIKTVSSVKTLFLMSNEPPEEVVREKERQDKLLEIPGVKISEVEIRTYPLGEAAAHLVGYVQSVTAEDLEEHKGEGYTANSVIGRSGMEGLFEKELKGQDGCRIYIVDANGNEKKEIANRPVEHGKTIKLTIDTKVQMSLYDQFKNDKGCSVSMNPKTGEVLALVSTPSYDNNGFVMGLSSAQWDAINEDEALPMYNRFRQVWCPGSTFKSITAAIGLESGKIDADENFGSTGLRWQKDNSWGSYYVTTLHVGSPSNLENSLVCSDNIYFARAALKIGASVMEESLKKLGFGVELPFEIKMAKSQYSNDGKIDSEVQLADTGYGQGELLINPLHMACIYSAFSNEGDIIKPYLVYQENAEPQYWIPDAFTKETAGTVLEGLKKVISDPDGTAYSVRREDVVLAGKTGTAEIKASQADTTGTEWGWFALFTPNAGKEESMLLISMVEDVKGRGGSGYVVKKAEKVMDRWIDTKMN